MVNEGLWQFGLMQAYRLPPPSDEISRPDSRPIRTHLGALSCIFTSHTVCYRVMTSTEKIQSRQT